MRKCPEECRLLSAHECSNHEFHSVCAVAALVTVGLCDYKLIPVIAGETLKLDLGPQVENVFIDNDGFIIEDGIITT
ncbi:unnamed protein product [Gongylonema pulchrum]|uniref:Clan AA aspartic protease n=1 Tax=Gongylonema pulchrum TaxID=637853 RepID=A0A183D4E2_9BILA|nr:unnamed protein product [Gongylonema pulchrum]